MDRIFGGAWVYVAHDSELPAPGDYKTTYRPQAVSPGQEATVTRFRSYRQHNVS
jgi:hypothetical protein